MELLFSSQIWIVELAVVQPLQLNFYQGQSTHECDLPHRVWTKAYGTFQEKTPMAKKCEIGILVSWP